MGSMSGGGMMYSTWGSMGNSSGGSNNSNSGTWMNMLGVGNSTNMGSISHMSPGSQYTSSDPTSSYSTSTARIMAWNRMHQQQRREQYNQIQSRGSLSLNPSQPYSSPSMMGLSDSGYQSGDSIDSMMAEDSEGSESSSSDA